MSLIVTDTSTCLMHAGRSVNLSREAGLPVRTQYESMNRLFKKGNHAATIKQCPTSRYSNGSLVYISLSAASAEGSPAVAEDISLARKVLGVLPCKQLTALHYYQVPGIQNVAG